MQLSTSKYSLQNTALKYPHSMIFHYSVASKFHIHTKQQVKVLYILIIMSLDRWC